MGQLSAINPGELGGRLLASKTVLLLEASHLRCEQEGHPSPTRILVKDRRTTQVILKSALLVCRLADIQQNTAGPDSCKNCVPGSIDNRLEGTPIQPAIANAAQHRSC